MIRVNRLIWQVLFLGVANVHSMSNNRVVPQGLSSAIRRRVIRPKENAVVPCQAVGTYAKKHPVIVGAGGFAVWCSAIVGIPLIPLSLYVGNGCSKDFMTEDLFEQNEPCPMLIGTAFTLYILTMFTGFCTLWCCYLHYDQKLPQSTPNRI